MRRVLPIAYFFPALVSATLASFKATTEDRARAKRWGFAETGHRVGERCVAAGLDILETGKNAGDLPALKAVLSARFPAQAQCLAEWEEASGALAQCTVAAADLTFFDFAKPKTPLAETALGNLTTLLSQPRGEVSAQYDAACRHCDVIEASDPTLGAEVRRRLDTIVGEFDEKTFRYLKRPTLEEIEAVAGPPTAFLFEEGKMPSVADMMQFAPEGAEYINPDLIGHMHFPEGVSQCVFQPPPFKPLVGLPKYILECLLEHYGLDLIVAPVGAGLGGSGLPLSPKEKASGAMGATKNISPMSKFVRERAANPRNFIERQLSKNLPFDFPTMVWNKYPRLRWVRPIATIVGRWVPGIGWIMLAADLALIGACVYGKQNTAED